MRFAIGFTVGMIVRPAVLRAYKRYKPDLDAQAFRVLQAVANKIGAQVYLDKEYN